jgi:hypothetical protein
MHGIFYLSLLNTDETLYPLDIATNCFYSTAPLRWVLQLGEVGKYVVVVDQNSWANSSDPTTGKGNEISSFTFEWDEASIQQSLAGWFRAVG